MTTATMLKRTEIDLKIHHYLRHEVDQIQRTTKHLPKKMKNEPFPEILKELKSKMAHVAPKITTQLKNMHEVSWFYITRFFEKYKLRKYGVLLNPLEN